MATRSSSKPVRFRSVLCAMAAVFLIGAARAEAQMSIISTQIDTGTNSLVAKGSSFPAGVRAFLFTVPFAELPVTFVTASEVHTTLPAAVPAGG